MSERRPRYAYCIRRVTPMTPHVYWDPAHKTEIHILQIIVDRVAVTSVPRHARIHPWKWDKREAKYSSRQPIIHNHLMQPETRRRA